LLVRYPVPFGRRLSTRTDPYEPVEIVSDWRTTGERTPRPTPSG